MNARFSFLHRPAIRPETSLSNAKRPNLRAWAALLCAWTLCFGLHGLRAQDAEGDNPTGTAGDYNGEVTTGGSYDAYTQNAKRSITDLTVPGSNGTYPLAFSRTYNSTGFATSLDAKSLGDGGNWRHSYMWAVSAADFDSNGNTTAFMVAYPDGATVVFRPNRSTTPAGEISNYWRGPVGTQDRLEVPVSGGSATSNRLHLSDGGIVIFGTGSGGHGVATAITDPYGATTTLTYGTNGLLSQVTEPGGRWLKFVYTTYSYKTPYPDANNNYYVYWNLLTQVQAGAGTTVRQTVTYNEVQFGQDERAHGTPEQGQQFYTIPYYVLGSVTYDMEPSASGSGKVTASYNYTQSADSVPVLLNAHDPHYTGAMVDIAYSYSAPALGWVLNESNYNASASSTGPSVSQLAVNGATRTETRGDKDASGHAITRTFSYGVPGNTTSPNGGMRYDSSRHAWVPTDASETYYSKAAQLTGLTDWQTNATSLLFYKAGDPNGQGNLQSVTDPLTHTTYYGHEPITGKVSSILLPDSRTRSWVYLSKNLSDPSNGPSVQPYYLYSATDERNQTTYYHRYPNTGLVNVINYPDNTSETFQYTGFGGTSPNFAYYKIGYQKSKLGAQTYYNYGTNSASGNTDLLLSVTRYYADATNTYHSETTTFQYDSLDRLILTTDPGGAGTRFSYNGRHQLTQTLHTGDSTHVDRVYDDLGNCTSVSDELQHVTQTVYDAYRRVTQVIVPVNASGQTTRTTYFSYEPRDTNHNALASATSHTRATWSVSSQQSSRAVERVYSSNNWLTDSFAGLTVSGGGAYGSSTVTPASGFEHTHTLYNTVGLAQTSYDGLNFATNYAYDSCNRLLTATDPNSHTTTHVYYAAGETASNGSGDRCDGLLKSITAPGPDTGTPTVTTRYADYDPMSRLRQSLAPPDTNSVPTVAFDSGYDAAGDLASQDDGAQSSGGHVTGYGYDQLGRKAICTYPDSTTERWTYNPSGTVATYVNRAQQTKTFAYDGRNRCTSYSWSNNAALAVGYEYDAASRQTRVYNASSDNHFTYDDSGALLSESAQLPGQPVLTTAYTHDVDGRVASIQYPHGDQPAYAYDAQGRCTDVSAAGSNTALTHYVYDGRGQLSVRALVYAGLDTCFYHQNDGRPYACWHYKGDSAGNMAANGSIRLAGYGYAPDGQLSWANRLAGYDQTGRNSALDDYQGDAYYYFPDGSLATARRNFTVANNAWPNQGSVTGDARVDPGNLANCGGSAPSVTTAYAYDLAGNRTAAGARTYPTAEGENRYPGMGYDANGNTVTSNDGWSHTYDADNQLTSASGPGGQSMAFAYDGLGRLSAENVNGLAKVYYYAGSQRIEERNSQTQAPLDQYFFDGPGSDMIFLRVDQARGYVWSLYDAQGNTTHLCDGNANVLEMYLYDEYGAPTVYDPYGNVRPSGTAWDQRYLFKGADAYQWYPAEGLYYCRARFYQPQNGRWLQPDPIGQAGGLNIYAYCHNDPVNKSDPSGLATSNGAGAHTDMPADMTWKFSETGSISDDYEYYCTASPSSMTAANAYANSNNSSGSAYPAITIYAAESDAEPEGTSEEAKEEKEETEQYGHKTGSIRGKYGVWDTLRGLFGHGPLAEAEAAAKAAEAEKVAKAAAKAAEAAEVAKAAKAAQEEELVPERYWLRKKAPTQVVPGTGEIVDLKPSSRKQGDVYTRTTHYDEYGRSVGQTHETDHGEPDVHSNPHYHVRNPISGEQNGPYPGVHPNY